MADINFYKYLEAAFRYRIYDPKGKLATADTRYSSFGYSLTYKKIFEYARKVLPAFYRNLAEFPNTEEGNLQLAKKVLEKLDKHQDTELETQFETIAAPSENEQIIAEAQTESQQVQTTAGSFAGSIPFGMPAAPTVSTATPRRIVVAEQTPPPTSGKAGGTGQGTAATSKINRLARQETSGLPSNTARRFNFSGFKIPNSFKNFSSGAQIFAKRNLEKVFNGLKGIAGSGLTGAANLGGRAGLGAINYGGNFLSNLSNSKLRLTNNLQGAGSTISQAKSKSGLMFILGILGFMILVGGIAATVPNATPGEAAPIAPVIGAGCPNTSSNTSEPSCHYLNPSINLFNTAISQSSVDAYITKYSPTFINAGKGDLVEFTKRVNYIITNSQQAGLNPAIFLGYWKSESNFSTMGSRDLGCAGDNFYEEVDCALGINKFSDPAKNPIANCARNKDANSTACVALKSVRQTWDKTNPVKYPIATFDDFAESYGPYAHLSDDGKHTNCTHTYNELIDTAEELRACHASAIAVPPPPADGNYTKWLQEYGIKFYEGFAPEVYQWAYEVLTSASQTGPKFKTLLGTAPIEIKPTCDITHTDGRTVFIRNRIQFCPGADKNGPTDNSNLFKQNFIHELGHIINGSFRPGKYGDQIKQAIVADKGYLTVYAEKAATGNKEICGEGNDDTRADEDFAESVSYFINYPQIAEQDYDCGTKSRGSNPFMLKSPPSATTIVGEPLSLLYAAHYQLMTNLLK